MKSVFNRVTTGIMAATLLVANLIMPVSPVLATDEATLTTNSAAAKKDETIIVNQANVKVWVCKYSGTPGEGEKAQTVNSVDQKPEYIVGGSFRDAQGLSFVVAIDNGQPKSEIESSCPTITIIPMPTLTVSDLCGAGNARYVLPQNTTQVTWSYAANGDLIATANRGYMFNDGTTTHSYGQPVETNTGECPVLTATTAVNGSFADICGTSFNLVFTPATTEGVTYTQTRDGNTITVTAAAKDGYILTNPGWTQTATDHLVPCIGRCVESTGSTLMTTKEQFATATPLNDQRADGHHEFAPNGLHIWTTLGNSTSKIAWYNDVIDYSLAEIGTPSMVYSGTGTAPGMQIALDANGDGNFDGILVGEPSAYGNNWWSNHDFGVGAGMGYASYGTLQDYLNANPHAMVMAVGFSLGSGVIGNGTLQSLTFGCYTWTFGKQPHVAQPCTATSNVYLQPWTFDGDTYPIAGADEGTIPGTYEFTNTSTFTGIRLTTPAIESYVYGLIDAGNTNIQDVDAMSYTTYRLPASAGYDNTLPAYILMIDKDGNPLTDDVTYLFYEPYNNGTVTEGTWQTWDAINGGNAKWWMSGTGQTLRTWNELKVALPDATVLAYGFNQGTYNAQTDTYIKSMTFDCATTTFSAPGRGGVTPPTVTPTTPATPVVTTSVALPALLPETGGIGISGVIVALTAAIATYGAMYYATTKRRYE